MTKQIPELICPTCRYDLAGIVREDNTATCPECGDDLEMVPITAPTSRWRTLGWMTTSFYILPLLTTVFVYALDPRASTMIAPAATQLMILSLPCIIALGLGMCFVETIYRVRKRPERFRPSLWLFVPLLLLLASAALVGQYVLTMWYLISNV